MSSTGPTHRRVDPNRAERTLLYTEMNRNGAQNSHISQSRQTSNPPRLQALIIGIDNYEQGHMPKLRGAVSDARHVEHFCITHLHVPRQQIVTHLDGEATRRAILDAISDLRRRKVRGEPARNGDPYLIYYAGHGAQHRAPEGWTTGRGKISMLIPHDRDYPIPDRTIGVLLHRLAEEKGDNISVIFDCCCSGSGTRYKANDPSQRQIRGVALDKDYIIPSTLDQDIWGSLADGQDRASTIAPGFLKAGNRSHVLLAACLEDERAHEQDGRGDFTRVLLDVLWSIDTHNTTYSELTQLVKQDPRLKHQIPQCEGYHSERKLFNTRAPSRKRIVHQVSHTHGSRCVMSAGSAHGIAAGALFSIYSSKDFDTNERPLATMEASIVRAYDSELAGVSYANAARVPYLPSPCFAYRTRLDRAFDLRLYISNAKGHGIALTTLEKEVARADYPVALAKKKARSDICVHERDGRVVLLVGDSITKLAYGLELQSPLTPHSSSIHPTLRAASQFFRHLRRAPEHSQLRSRIVVELHELQQDCKTLDGRLRPLYKPAGKNLLRRRRNGDIVLEVVADERQAYGITITSQFDTPLHIWAFYFDCSDLSISPYYEPTTHGPGGAPSLPARGRLGIGHGDGGGRPFNYFVRDGQMKDVGFIKLFILSKPVDLSDIPQTSPFEGKNIRGSRLLPVLEENAWDMVIITVLQYRTATLLGS